MSWLNPPTPKTPQETARTFTRQGDYSNAIVVLNGALKSDPTEPGAAEGPCVQLLPQQGLYQGEAIAKPLTDRPDADVQTYQLLALFYKATDDLKECEHLYKDGLKRWPHSGVLYSEYGEIMGAKESFLAIKQWEKGIETDPNYAGNYYNAAKYYFTYGDKLWTLLYGEIFINLESYSKRTAEIKQLLLDGYKKLFVNMDELSKNDDHSKSAFMMAWLHVMIPLAPLVRDGVTSESLTVLRTRFIINWFNTYPGNYPFRLFDYQQQLLKDGMFDAYNQWIFGAAGNLPAFQTWTNTHSDDYNRFINYQKGRIFKLPQGQYYQLEAK